jgi:hypothetical protein
MISATRAYEILSDHGIMIAEMEQALGVSNEYNLQSLLEWLGY